VTEADLVRKVIGYRLNAAEIPVGVIMNTPIVDIDINASVHLATELMESKRIRHLGVSEDGKIVGVLSVRDLIGMIAVRDLPRFFSK
jgi:CBS domain-containing protein